ncbi:hypothetical protein [Streptomyces sp. Isolate_45]|uniref:hypothetical protein n=1 Tax=Streptomyces sp. Isolate_45 TaxID=2950111 RepID=UPI002481E82B|nr:hypothetical protein [Streptomyces sp. Isolate_45]MDA5283872.1 hypothetical protein [Streptomyces sp. Isolate_45]
MRAGLRRAVRLLIVPAHRAHRVGIVLCKDTGRPVVTGQPDTGHLFSPRPAVTARGEVTGRVLLGTESMSA